MKRMLTIALLLTITGCDSDTDTATGPATEPATDCPLITALGDCPLCDDGPATCSYGTYSESVDHSCGDCQAMVALYTTLCDAGVTDSEEDIQAGLTCTQP